MAESESAGASTTAPANPEIVKVLKSAALFRNFTDTGVQLVASIAQEKHIPGGTPLFVENMIGEALYVVADGMIRLAVRGAPGPRVDLDRTRPRRVARGSGAAAGRASALFGHGRGHLYGHRDLPPRHRPAPAHQTPGLP
jgi:CRP-like cAMP-binding protein